MPSEIDSLRRYEFGSGLRRIVACLDGLSEHQMNWRPSSPAANSLFTITVHALANAEENVLGTLCGETIQRDRESEFSAVGASADAVRTRAESLEARIRDALARLTPLDLSRTCEHPRRGTLAGREVLLIAGRHAAEHVGEAELTLGLLRAAEQQ